MMRPIGQFLTEFRPGGPVPPPLGLPASAEFSLLPDLSAEPGLAMPDLPGFDAEPGLEAEAFPPVDFSDGVGVPDSISEPAPDMAAQLAALQAEHEAALAAARAQWAAEEGAALAERFGQAMGALEERLATLLAPLLEPFLARAARMKAFGQLHDMLGTLLANGEARALTVSGPADLVAALRDSYGDRPGLAFAENDEPDVTIALGDTRIRSQLRAFARKLDAALGA